MPLHRWLHPLLVVCVLGIPQQIQAQTFVNFESGHVRPLALSPDHGLLFAVNTPDNRLAIFTVTAAGISLATEVPVGLEPVAVATRANGHGRIEAWVVNHLSDSVSIVEADPTALDRAHVVRTLLVGDEPHDIVVAAAAGGDRVFVSTARRGQNCPLPALATRAGVGRALVWSFDAEHPGAALGGTPLSLIELSGDTPRALALSPDGGTVYAAIFHSGNQTTALSEAVVSANGGLPPAPDGATPHAPPTGLIVKYDADSGHWLDEIRRDWSAFVPFTLPDRDVFVIDARANPPALASGRSSVSGVGTTLFDLAVRPSNGHVFVSNLEARNQVRFEPAIDSTRGLRGHFVDNRLTVISEATVQPVSLNPQIDYGNVAGSESERVDSLALPMGMTFSPDGRVLYMTAFGSSTVAIIDADALESGSVTAQRVAVGAGPSGLALDAQRRRLYVMNRIDHSISIISDIDDPRQRATLTVPLGFDPTPAAIRAGRRFLYDARNTSAHGDAACASCHVFGDLDHLAWDLGDPFAPALHNPNPFAGSAAGADFHPLKGPMTTQSLRGLAHAGPMHWRGDRTAGNDANGNPFDERGAFAKFNATFVALLGRATELSPADLHAFTDFALSISYPPNPLRALDNRATPAEAAGERFFRTTVVDGVRRCQDCHVLPFGTAGLSAFVAEPQQLKVPHLRNLYQKIGRFGAARDGSIRAGDAIGEQIRGFGFLHDGSLPTATSFRHSPTFDFRNDAERHSVEAFLLAFDTGLRPVVGQQVTVGSAAVGNRAVQRRLALLRARHDAGDCELVVHGIVDGRPRGFLYDGHATYRADRATSASVQQRELDALARRPGQELTYTCAPPGSGLRMALDRDENGVLDGDQRY